MKPLLDYRGFDYWMDQPWRSINQLVAHMRSVPRLLDPTDPLHLALFFDLTWLYTLSLARAVEHIRAMAVADVETTLSRYVVGGELAWRERQQMSELLRAATPSEALIDVPEDGVLPPWHSMLLEIVGRMQRVPSVAGPMLRYAEWMTAALCARKRITIGQAFGATADPRAAKMLTDVAGFLVAATGLHPGFRSMARDLVVTDLAGGTPTFSVATGEPGRDTA